MAVDSNVYMDDLALAAQGLGGPMNTVIFDDLGNPDFMVRVPLLYYKDVIPGSSSNSPLPCFVVNGQTKPEILVSKFQNIVKYERGYSLPYRDPKPNINYDTSRAVCQRKGPGYSLMPNSAYSAIAYWCLGNETIPNGNNNYGSSYENSFEKGVPSYTVEGVTYRTATGTGPKTWFHNHDFSGIADLNGNVWEWADGLRLVNGEIQIIPDANCMLADCSTGENSTEWRAIMPNGNLVDPGTKGTLHFNGSVEGDDSTESVSKGVPILDTKADKKCYTGDGNQNGNYGYYYRSLQSLVAADGVKVPEILVAQGLFPGAADLQGDGLWVRNTGERLPLRGGAYDKQVVGSGVFSTALLYPRSLSYAKAGFRSALFDHRE